MLESTKSSLEKSISTKLRKQISIGHKGLDDAFDGGIRYGWLYHFKGRDAMNSAIGKRLKGVARKAIVVTKLECEKEIIALKMRAREEDRPVFIVGDLKHIHPKQCEEWFEVIVDLSKKGTMNIEKQRWGQRGSFQMNGTELITIREENAQRANPRTAYYCA